MTNEQLSMNFWGRIEQAQQFAHKPSLKLLCRQLGIPYQTIINQKSSARLPSLEITALFARELNCSVDWLLYGTEQPKMTDEVEQLTQTLMLDPRRRLIALRICQLNPAELFAIEVFLGIKK